MTSVNYPIVIHSPHYEVVWESKAGLESVLGEPDRLYTSRRDAEHALARLQQTPGFDGLFITTHDPVYLLRCVECGARPEGTDFVQSDWIYLADAVRLIPGWVTTDEQLVYCPQHRPGGEQ